jgi:AAA domain/UvrD-like helicase C-terminal domain
MTPIKLTPEQETLVNKAVAFAEKCRSHPDYSTLGSIEEFVIAGKAGTGKTTATMEIVRRLKELGFKPCVMAPTGKAAHVLNSKNPELEATTIHKALSTHPIDFLAPIHAKLNDLDKQAMIQPLTDQQKEEESELYKQLDSAKKSPISTLGFEPTTTEEFTADGRDIIICDEASMVGLKSIYNPLMAHIRVPKIFIGDSAQLKPVLDVPAINLDHPDAKLETIMRQAEGSGILTFAHNISKGMVMTRKGASKYSDLTIVPDHDVKALLPFLKDHTVICHTNKERHKFNTATRQERGVKFENRKYPFLPCIGEMLVVDTNMPDQRLLRGQLLEVIEDCSIKSYFPMINPYLANIKVRDDSGRERKLYVNIADLVGTDPLLKNKTEDSKYRHYANKKLAVRFSYSFTSHSAQGSEFDKVAVVGSMMPDAGGETDQWYYTAATRAKHALVIASYYYAHDKSLG